MLASYMFQWMHMLVCTAPNTTVGDWLFQTGTKKIMFPNNVMITKAPREHKKITYWGPANYKYFPWHGNKYISPANQMKGITGVITKLTVLYV